MNILFIGDGLINGTVGINWVSLLARKYPSWHIENAGANFDTLSKVLERLQSRLDFNSNYDFIVLGAGSNDLLIPSFSKRGFLYRQARLYLLQRGYNASNEVKNFESLLHDIISLIQQKCRAKLILLTMGCINECQGNQLNTLRLLCNEVIRDLAWDKHCRLADVAADFESHLKRQPGADYLLANFFNTVVLDRWQSAEPGRVDQLSRERGLQLTLDGVHLNSRGARIYIGEVERQILRFK